MRRARKNIRSSYVMANAMALASPLTASTAPALLAAIMVVVTLVLFGRVHSWMLVCLALFTLALATFGVLLTINPAILFNYLG